RTGCIERGDRSGSGRSHRVDRCRSVSKPGEAESPPVPLRRSLGIASLTLYGLAVIIGAGIYVAIASVVARAGEAAPLSFLLAGIAAVMTGLCYAELASRFPEAAGAAA